METNIIFCADLLGFSRINYSLQHVQLNERIDIWLSLISSSANKFNIDYRIVSDTVFAKVPEDYQRFCSLIDFARQLLSLGVKYSLPIRGGIVKGSCCWGDQLIYGKGIIAAHQLEKSQSWIGVAIDDSVDRFENEAAIGLVDYQVPMRSEQEVKLMRTVSWDVPDYANLIKLLTNEKNLKWGELQKINNTFIYGKYLKYIKTYGIASPIKNSCEFIEHLFTQTLSRESV